MKDNDKTKERLINELGKLEIQCKRAEEALAKV